MGQGIANAVGLAIAEAHLAATFNKSGFDIINNYTFCIVGDGCLQEGVSAEASSLAGHLGLGKLIVLYDDNQIQIDGGTNLAFSEDVLKRYESYGWHTQYVPDGDANLQAILEAVQRAKDVKDKPSIIKVKTTIGFGSKMAGTEKVHGAPLGVDEVAAVKKKFGFDSEKVFYVPDEVKRFYAGVKERGAKAESEWSTVFAKYSQQFPQLAAEFQRRVKGDLPANWKDNLPRFTPTQPAVATRKLSENVLNAIAEQIPELVGGSADLTHSNLTRWKTAVDFQKESTQLGNYGGRYFRFGVREHGMVAICNGIAAYGALIPFCATFLNFIGYAQGAFRLSALSHFRVVYIMTHDSIGLGEDGPTHQPVEILALLRSTPNCLVLRPADGNETSGAYIAAFESSHKPSVLCLTRQNLPQLEGSSVEKTLKGAYVLQDIGSGPAVNLIMAATGSEVSLIVDTAKLMTSTDASLKIRIVSMPCWELFDAQPVEYKQSVFPTGIPVLGCEAMSTFGWDRYAHACVGMTTFGASAPCKDVYKKLGLVPQSIADKAKKVMEYYKSNPVPQLIGKPF